MRPEEDMEKFVKIRKPHATTSREMDERTLNDSFAAMDQIIQAKQTKYKRSAPKVIIRNRIMRPIAAAAVIVVVISLFIVHRGPDEEVDTVIVSNSTKSAAELLTVASLNMAFRRGGIEAVEKQCEQVIDKLGLQPARIRVEELLAEFNGT
jgi:hypothetical protein